MLGGAQPPALDPPRIARHTRTTGTTLDDASAAVRECMWTEPCWIEVLFREPYWAALGACADIQSLKVVG